MFYTAWRNHEFGIEYIIKGSALEAFRANYTVYRAAANAFYVNGIPPLSQIQMAAGDYWEGLWNANVDAITNPAHYVYLAHVMLGTAVNTSGISFQSSTIRNTQKVSITIDNYSASQFRNLIQQKRGGTWIDHGQGKPRLVSGNDEYFYYPVAESTQLPSIQYTRNGKVIGVFRFNN